MPPATQTAELQERAETQALAHKAFWHILASGRPPTVDLVNEHLLITNQGKRNRNAISLAIKECWSEVGKRTAQSRNIPGLPSETVDLVIALRENMLQLASQQFAAETEAMKSVTAAAIAERDAQIARLQEMLEQSRDSALSLGRECEKLSSELTTSLDTLLATQNELQEARKTVAAHVASIAALQDEREHLQRAMHAAEESHKAALSLEKERFDVTRKALQQQVDDERTRAAKITTKLEKAELDHRTQIASAHHRERELTDSIAKLSAELGLANGITAALTAQADNLQAMLNERTAASAVAEQRNNSLRTQIAELERAAKERAYAASIDAERIRTLESELAVLRNAAAKSQPKTKG